MADEMQERRGCLLWFTRLFGGSRRGSTTATRDGAPGATSSGPTHTYALRDDFLSPAEASFFHILRRSAPNGTVVFPKVRLADLIYAPQQEERHTAWQRINRKHVDFVLCDDTTLRPLAAIELDDRSHRRPDRLERDAFVDRVFADAGLPLVHLQVRRSYDPRDLAETLSDVLARRDATGLPSPPAVARPAPAAGASGSPTCERCGGQMQLRTAKQGQHAGERFWGCTNYPRCRHTLPA